MWRSKALAHLGLALLGELEGERQSSRTTIAGLQRRLDTQAEGAAQQRATIVQLEGAKRSLEELVREQQRAILVSDTHAKKLSMQVGEQGTRIESLQAEKVDAQQAIETLKDQKGKLQEAYTHLVALHSGRVRVCSFTVDPVQLTAALRRIDGGLRAEWDGAKVVIYSDVKLTQAKMNALKSLLDPQVDVT